MKHLRKFNENNINKLDELKDFCESNLAFLLDDLIKIDYEFITFRAYNSSISGTPISHKTSCYTINIVPQETEVRWLDIKDYFIPFIERLSSYVYNIIPLNHDNDIISIKYIDNNNYKPSHYNYYSRFNHYNYYDIIKDEVKEEIILSIRIKVEI